MGIAGLGLLAGGAGAAIVARNDYDLLLSSCGPRGDQCPPGGGATRDEGRRMETASYVLLPLGVAALAVGVVTLALETRRPRLTARPILAPGAVGLSFTGGF